MAGCGNVQNYDQAEMHRLNRLRPKASGTVLGEINRDYARIKDRMGEWSQAISYYLDAQRNGVDVTTELTAVRQKVADFTAHFRAGYRAAQ